MKLSELTDKELMKLCDEHGIEYFDDFDAELYTSDALSHETIDVMGLSYTLDDVLRSVDPVAFRQISLDYEDNLHQDGMIEYLKCGAIVWTQDREDDLETLGLEV